jgi:isoleucyl-tRNA synthetase
MRFTQALRAAQSHSTSKAISWTHTLNLPKSSLPPVPPTPTPDCLHAVTTKLYKWQQETRSQKPPFVLHDGPPYANGDLHLGHAINKILKDIICRFQISQGRMVEYVPGWDCHGLPIELKALQQLPKGQDAGSAVKVRELARQLAEKTVESQKEEFKSWAVIGDWESAYRTMDKDYIVRELEIFRELVEKDLISYDRMPVYFSPSSKTVLAEAELEYNPNYVSQCAFVRYPLVGSEIFGEFRGDGVFPEKLGALIWTTTPWTLPGNKLIAAGSDILYCVVSLKKDSK